MEFKPDKIDALGPGEVRQIKMEIFAPERTIAGDYMLTLTANSPESNKSADFRVTVSTPASRLCWRIWPLPDYSTPP